LRQFQRTVAKHEKEKFATDVNLPSASLSMNLYYIFYSSHFAVGIVLRLNCHQMPHNVPLYNYTMQSCSLLKHHIQRFTASPALGKVKVALDVWRLQRQTESLPWRERQIIFSTILGRKICSASCLPRIWAYNYRIY
jgi:hypothetical protein